MKTVFASLFACLGTTLPAQAAKLPTLPNRQLHTCEGHSHDVESSRAAVNGVSGSHRSPLLVARASETDSTKKAAVATLLFKGDFENGSLARFGDSEFEQTIERVRIVTSPVRYGKRALEVTLDRSTARGRAGYRTDFWIKGMSRKFPIDDEYWYGFSSYWPKSWKPDTQSELFVQWIGEGTSSPPLAIYVYGENYRIKRRWAFEQDAYKNLWSGMVAKDRGVWIDWVFHVKWSPEKNGRVEVWKNGEKIVSDRGPNCGPSRFAPYFKFGIYKWPWKRSPKEAPSAVTHRTLYLDEIRIASGPARYELVIPPRAPAN